MSEFIKKLRQENIRKMLPRSLGLILAAVVVMLVTSAYKTVQLFSPKTLSQLTPETAAGAYVEDDILFLYGEFIEESTYDENGDVDHVVSRYYIVDFDPAQYYMALKVHASDLEDAEAMMDASDEYYTALLNGTEMPPLPWLHVRGTIREMEQDDLDLLEDYAAGDEQFLTSCLPLYLDVGRIGNLPISSMIFAAVVCLVLLAVGLGMLIYGASSAGLKQVKEKAAAMDSPESNGELLCRFLEDVHPVCGVRLGREFVLYRNGTSFTLLRPWDIAWAYADNEQMGGAAKSVVLRLMDGTRKEIRLTSSQVAELLSAMMTALPGTFFGFSQELELLYRNRIDVFAAHWEDAVPGSTGVLLQDPSAGKETDALLAEASSNPANQIPQPVNLGKPAEQQSDSQDSAEPAAPEAPEEKDAGLDALADLNAPDAALPEETDDLQDSSNPGEDET